MWYELDIKKLAVLLMPTFLRRTAHIKWLWMLVKPLEDIFYQWQQFRTDNIYKLNHNSQVCRLRKVLNDYFDPIERRIIIIDGYDYERQYLFTEVEQQPVYLGTMYLYRDSDYSDAGYDFIVLAPPELLDKDNYEMHALIDYYKLAGKRYNIDALKTTI